MRGIKLREESKHFRGQDDYVVGVAAVDEADHSWILTVKQDGRGNRTDIDEYLRHTEDGPKKASRYTYGVRNINVCESRVCAVESVGPGDQAFLMSANGKIIRTPVGDTRERDDDGDDPEVGSGESDGSEPDGEREDERGISIQGRTARGVIIMRTESDDNVAAVDTVPEAVSSSEATEAPTEDATPDTEPAETD